MSSIWTSRGIDEACEMLSVLTPSWCPFWRCKMPCLCACSLDLCSPSQNRGTRLFAWCESSASWLLEDCSWRVDQAGSCKLCTLWSAGKGGEVTSEFETRRPFLRWGRCRWLIMETKQATQFVAQKHGTRTVAFNSIHNHRSRKLLGCDGGVFNCSTEPPGAG